MAARAPSVISVIDTLLGGTNPAAADTMSAEQIDALARAVVDFYETWEPPRVTGDRLSIYSGISVGMRAIGEPATDDLLRSLLYCPQIAINCPLADWFTWDRPGLSIKFGPSVRRSEMWTVSGDLAFARSGYFWTANQTDLSELRTTVKNLLAIIHQLRELIEAGIVVLVPQWRIARDHQASIEAAMRHDVKDDSFYSLVRLTDDSPVSLDRLPTVGGSGLIVSPNTFEKRPDVARHEAIDPASFFLNKAILVADKAGTAYVPTRPPDLELFTSRLERVRKELKFRSKRDYSIVPEVSKLQLPLFEGLSPADLIAARKNESAFNDFRAALRDAYLRAGVGTVDPSFPDQVRGDVEEIIGGRIREVEAAVMRSATLKAAATEGTSTIVIGAASLATVPIGALPLQVGAGAAATGVVAALYRMIFRPKQTGANAVIAALLHKR